MWSVAKSPHVAEQSNNSNPCYISAWCVEDKSKPRQRDYVLTHQVLFWQLAEMWQCIQQVPENIRDRLCSNVLRDAEMTERMNFPMPFADLFLEQSMHYSFFFFFFFCSIPAVAEFDRQTQNGDSRQLGDNKSP
ncbi:UPF0764 protein C16orf89 [Trichonephila clavipes]|nr:UPF0764 protein C16orf89 [Trichonephila clavipes]